MIPEVNISSLIPLPGKFFIPDLKFCQNYNRGYQNQARKVNAVLLVFKEDFSFLKKNVSFNFFIKLSIWSAILVGCSCKIILKFNR